MNTGHGDMKHSAGNPGDTVAAAPKMAALRPEVGTAVAITADIPALERNLGRAVSTLEALQGQVEISRYRATAFGLPESSRLKALERALRLEQGIERFRRVVRDLCAELVDARKRSELQQMQQASRTAEALGPEGRERIRLFFERLLARIERAAEEQNLRNEPI